jgi:hypothetical protein
LVSELGVAPPGPAGARQASARVRVLNGGGEERHAETH